MEETFRMTTKGHTLPGLIGAKQMTKQGKKEEPKEIKFYKYMVYNMNIMGKKEYDINLKWGK